MKKTIFLALLALTLQARAQVLEPMPLPEPLFTPTAMNVLNGKMLFVAQSSVHGKELWSTDGTSEGTFLVKEINNVFDAPAFNAFTYNDSRDSRGCFANLGTTKMLFSAADGLNSNPQLWVTDGTTAGTFKIIVQGMPVNYPKWYKEFNGKLYFIAGDTPNGYEIWSTDGTIAGTGLLTNIRPGGGSAFTPNWDPCFMVFNNKMYFKADDGVNGIELWSTDGTATGTAMVKNINVGGTTDPDAINAFKIVNNYNNTPFIAAGNYFYFSAYAGTFEAGGFNWLYRSDGTAAGTVAISCGPMQEGASASNFFSPAAMTLFNDDLYFFGSALGGTTLVGGGLWHVDSATDQFTFIYPVNGRGDNGLSDATPMNSMREFNGKLYFQGIASGDKLHFWSTDGTAAGTQKIFQTSNNLDSFISQEYMRSIVYNNKLYFVAGTIYNENVYATDGTTAGTTAVFAAAPFTPPYQFTVYANSVVSGKPGQPSQTTMDSGNTALYFGAHVEIATGNLLYRIRPENLSIAENKIAKEIIVSPNPTRGNAVIRFPQSVTNATITAHDMLGQQVFQKRGCTGDEVNLDLSSLSTGIYILTADSGATHYTKKIVIK